MLVKVPKLQGATFMEKPNPSGKKPEVKEVHFSNKTTTKLEIHVVEYNPVGGSSYILLPEKTKRKNHQHEE